MTLIFRKGHDHQVFLSPWQNSGQKYQNTSTVTVRGVSKAQVKSSLSGPRTSQTGSHPREPNPFRSTGVLSNSSARGCSFKGALL